MSSIKLKGDTSGEITIDAPAVSGTNTLTLPAETGTLVTQNALGVRNIIINGDMKIAQRGTSATGKTTSGYYTCDRWNNVFSGAGTWTFTQDTDVPNGQGFANSLKMNCTTANASIAAADSFQLHTRFEGQNLQHLKKGTANAESVTLSFWVKSNKTGTYVVNLQDIDNTRIIGKTYSIDTADTWEKKTLTFAGDTSGTLDNDNGQSMRVAFWFASGSNYTSGTTPTSWEAKDDADQAGDLTVNLADSTSNYINITGVQLEVGDTATPFEHRPYDMELARCQRYYQVIDAGVNAYSPTGIIGFPFNTAMRAAPTLTFSFSGIANRVYRIDTGGTFDLTVAATNLTDKSFVSLFATSPANWAGTHGVGFRSTFAFSAEL